MSQDWSGYLIGNAVSSEMLRNKSFKGKIALHCGIFFCTELGRRIKHSPWNYHFLLLHFHPKSWKNHSIYPYYIVFQSFEFLLALLVMIQPTLKFPLIPHHKATTVSQNHCIMINAAQRTLRKHPENTERTRTPRTSWEHSENTERTHTPRTTREASENTKRTPREHSPHLQRVPS